ncbi:L-aspartate oxidase [uncultured Ruminococcus sp.]|nr:L-aspartate oxidase [uncultured Ruminococcus sp.]
MEKQIRLGDCRIPATVLDAVVVGSGAAGYNAADWLYDLGCRDIALITDGIQRGTSRNTGSDKQTYYKLSLAGDAPDSVGAMAQELFDGEGVDGDIALAEAAGSVRSFIKLANLGVPFPTNRYGEYVGYRTDHEQRGRATSAGPLTSKYMTECLERAVRQKKIRVDSPRMAVQLLTEGNEVQGLICLDLDRLDNEACGLCAYLAPYVILCTGGPAGVYEDRVYPESQVGMSGMALEAGAVAANLQEWQYGLASTKFRWNVSGSYQQVLPSYRVRTQEGMEKEFLPDYFSSAEAALGAVFRKGYEWPFSIGRVSASSRVDVAVYHETCVRGGRVFLDYRTDPAGLNGPFSRLEKEAYDYLSNSQALVPGPLERLLRMNRPAVELYRAHGIDLSLDPLEIRVCAQHCNGGLAVDASWQTSVQGLYAAGEAAGTFGVHRPGGSALNSTQVGSMRAAEAVALRLRAARFDAQAAMRQAQEQLAVCMGRLRNAFCGKTGSRDGGVRLRRQAQREMSRWAAQIRDIEGMRGLSEWLQVRLNGFFAENGVQSPQELPELLRNRDILLTQYAVLSAMITSAERVGSRGSALVRSREGEPGAGLDGRLADYAYKPQAAGFAGQKLVTELRESAVSRFEPVRPLPGRGGWFETVWKEYRERQGGFSL